MPSQLIQSVTAFKTPQADQIEGGIAGIVNTRLRRPFDFADTQIAGSVRGFYDEESDRLDPYANILVSDRFDTEMGVLASPSYHTLSFRPNGAGLGPFLTGIGAGDRQTTWRSWSDIDPTVFTDDNGTSWLAWGYSDFYLARLKPNMVEIDGDIREIKLPYYVEGPWLHKRGNIYYLTYASIDEPSQKKERISYATACDVTGPWAYRGELTGEATNSFTIHAGIERFKGKWYFFYHDGTLDIADQKGGEYRRSVAVEQLEYGPDGAIRPIVQAREGVSLIPGRSGTPTATASKSRIA